MPKKIPKAWVIQMIYAAEPVDPRYTERMEYLQGLAEDYGVPTDVVLSLAEILGPNEDHDGLIVSLEDYADSIYN